MERPYSTVERDAARGKVFSSRSAKVTVQPGAPLSSSPRPATQHRFDLLATAHGAAQSGIPLTGWATVSAVSGDTFQVAAAVRGLAPPRDPAVVPVLWLIHQVGGTGPTAPGVWISPGAFTPGANGEWTLHAEVGPGLNRAFHPLSTLGPAVLADINASLPSGTVASIWHGMYAQRGSVHPELDPERHFEERLSAISAEVLAHALPRFLRAEEFERAAVTLEGLVRGTPRLCPTADSCILAGSRT